ncbi:dihydrodipicolinate synthase family protein [Pseudomonas huanghezhanensis]|uniref:dihydrodipicolinate synthase family protein n=1 Tax=Pseudomonas huanghezhanensis TaxID=3002903 RepID=UPI0022867A59|nr:dihydrodipicolinate synthase family protein [Pseudomonas sp. BSw22131]
MKFDNGVLIANLLPFNQDLSVNWEALSRHTRQLKDIDSVRGFVVNAYAGEGPTLTQSERSRSIELHRELANDDQPIVACILDMSTAGAIAQAKTAKTSGANALLICPPVVSGWNASASPHIALDYHRAIADAVDLPIILFQLSIGDPVAYSHDLLMSLVREIDSVIGVKMAQANDAVRYDQDYLGLQKAGRPIAALPAVGSSMFHGLTTGAQGILTGLATFAPYEITELWRASISGDLARAREIHLQLAEINHLIYGSPYVDLHTRYKEFAYLAGAIPTPYVRGPQVRVSAQEQSTLKDAFLRAKLKALPDV